MQKISAVILARNEEANIRNCLETVRWCDEIAVVDMESEDGTAAIAREYTDKVFTHRKIVTFDAAKQFAVEKATGDWILLVDADEMVPKRLAGTLREVASGGTADVVEIPFRHYIMGDWVRNSGWGNSPLPRFFRRGKMVFTGVVHLYMRPAAGAATRRLDPSPGLCIHHFNYVDSAHFVEKLNRYTTIEALHMREANVSFTYGRLIVASLREFFGRFLKGRGFKDGPRGFSLCLMMAFYRALSHIKLWEAREFGDNPVTARYDAVRRKVLADWKETPS